MVKKTEENIAYGQDRRISRLLTNETFWMKYVQRYNLKLFEKSKIYTMEQLENIYGDWDVYESNVRNYEKYKPSPDDSDACIALLGDHPIAEGSANVETICKTPKSCRDGASNGNDFGYFLTHRVLFLLLAQFARGCSIFSVKEDKDKLEKYCGIIFNEAQFIATHDYKRPDLFMEQIAICTLLGHAQFLQDDWMKPLMALQTSSGCFTDNWRIVGENELPMVELPGDEWMLSNNIVMNRACSGHTTAVAAAMLASAIRYIVENNYSSAT
ncbi:uncharacterized protein LOC113494521 isoform X2 [Trichoplusia ni]|nr:uncharacterized protein LOC113494521 isoform X2 [Trichoplusia ni]